MNICAIQKNTYFGREEMAGKATGAGGSIEKKEAVVCPKPQRLGRIHATLNDFSYMRPLRWHVSQYQEASESQAGNELLDIILAKGGGCGADQPFSPVASSPPFLLGSPPSRVSNPLIQDAHFREKESTPILPCAIPIAAGSVLAPSPSSTRCAGATFGYNPSVRIEGFNCLNRDRRNGSIPALA